MDKAVNRELLILRHAKSDWAPGTANDFDRPLSKRGRRVSKKLGKWLRSQTLIPQQIVCSTAERARQTALRVCQFADLTQSIISWQPTIYEARLETLLELIASVPNDINRLMLIGHNPGLEYLVRYLADDSLDAWDTANLMPTAALARLLMPMDWRTCAPACAEVASIDLPRILFEE